MAYTTPQRPLTWLITGCSSGLGLELVRQVQANGHNVIATSRNPSRTPDLVHEIETKGGNWLTLDVTDTNSAELVEDLEARGTHIDVLVNNAGTSIHHVVEEFTDEEVRTQLDLLYLGPFRLIRAAVPHMRARRFGIVVNISSGAGIEGRESMGAYAGAKAGLDAVTKVLAKEVAAFNVRAIYVSLGTLDTNMPRALVLGERPMPEDYKGSMAERLMTLIKSDEYSPDGDRAKAAKAIYEVVMGKGAGAGLEAEHHLPLGRDAFARIKDTVNKYNHTMEVFGPIANSVYREKVAQS